MESFTKNKIKKTARAARRIREFGFRAIVADDELQPVIRQVYRKYPVLALSRRESVGGQGFIHRGFRIPPKTLNLTLLARSHRREHCKSFCTPALIVGAKKSCWKIS